MFWRWEGKVKQGGDGKARAMRCESTTLLAMPRMRDKNKAGRILIVIVPISLKRRCAEKKSLCLTKSGQRREYREMV